MPTVDWANVAVPPVILTSSPKIAPGSDSNEIVAAVVPSYGLLARMIEEVTFSTLMLAVVLAVGSTV